jgi:hypothetical protein
VDELVVWLTKFGQGSAGAAASFLYLVMRAGRGPWSISVLLWRLAGWILLGGFLSACTIHSRSMTDNMWAGALWPSAAAGLATIAGLRLIRPDLDDLALVAALAH